MSLDHLDDCALDLLSLGIDLPEAADSRAHLETCADCRAALAERGALRGHFERDVLPRTLGKVRARIQDEQEAPARSRPFAWLFPLAACAALAVVGLKPAPETAPAADGDLRVKGGATLQLFVKRGEQVFEAHEGDALQPGDAVRFVIFPGGEKNLVVGSVDGAGHASIYLPQQGTDSSTIEPDRTYTSPLSITLDAAPGPERVFAILSPAPLSLERVKAALRELGRGGAPAIRSAQLLSIDGTTQATLRFEKLLPSP
jgi:hypothetical protein